MRSTKSSIVVFEHESLRTDKGDKRLTKEQWESLMRFYGENGVPYFTPIHNGIKFNEYVGVIQVGNLTIEVLPKADKTGSTDQWRKVLVGMLRASGIFDISAPSTSELKLRSNSILDLYFELFINEIEYLLHHGLAKKYRKTEGNIPVFKGSIVFNKHIQQNLVHQERVYSKYSIFDVQHPLHLVLYKAIQLVSRINSNSALQSRIGALLLNFPEMPDIRVSEKLFSKIILNRNTIHYQKAFEIAKLLLLNYHPDISRGRNNVLALMFDMNVLWEKFVYKSIRSELSSTINIKSQTSKSFWKPEIGSKNTIRPDIHISTADGRSFVIDTKWKNLTGTNPSSDDLQQLFVYHEYFQATKVAIVFPGNDNSIIKGKYISPASDSIWDKECCMMPVMVEQNIHQWQKGLCKRVLEWVES